LHNKFCQVRLKLQLIFGGIITMPNVDGKMFSYDKKGMQAAAKAKAQAAARAKAQAAARANGPIAIPMAAAAMGRASSGGPPMGAVSNNIKGPKRNSYMYGGKVTGNTMYSPGNKQKHMAKS
jgi:hypothetical protein